MISDHLDYQRDGFFDWLDSISPVRLLIALLHVLIHCIHISPGFNKWCPKPGRWLGQGSRSPASSTLSHHLPAEELHVQTPATAVHVLLEGSDAARKRVLRWTFSLVVCSYTRLFLSEKPPPVPPRQLAAGHGSAAPHTWLRCGPTGPEQQKYGVRDNRESAGHRRNTVPGDLPQAARQRNGAI